MKKRFWMLPEWEIESAFEQAAETIAPSRAIVSLLREVRKILKRREESSQKEA